jgi:hypothetical protein
VDNKESSFVPTVLEVLTSGHILWSGLLAAVLDVLTRGHAGQNLEQRRASPVLFLQSLRFLFQDMYCKVFTPGCVGLETLHSEEFGLFLAVFEVLTPVAEFRNLLREI